MYRLTPCRVSAPKKTFAFLTLKPRRLGGQVKGLLVSNLQKSRINFLPIHLTVLGLTMYNFISLMKRQNPSNTPGTPLCTVHSLASVSLAYLTLNFPLAGETAQKQ